MSLSVALLISLPLPPCLSRFSSTTCLPIPFLLSSLPLFHLFLPVLSLPLFSLSFLPINLSFHSLLLSLPCIYLSFLLSLILFLLCFLSNPSLPALNLLSLFTHPVPLSPSLCQSVLSNLKYIVTSLPHCKMLTL